MSGEDDVMHDLVGAYALDALSPAEVEAFEAHLRTCPSCQAEVVALREVVDVLPLAAEPVEPPAALRDRLLTEVRREREEGPSLAVLRGGREERRRRFRPRPGPALAVAAAAAIAGLIGWNIDLQQQVHHQPAALSAQVAQAIAQGATVSTVTGTSAAPRAHAALVQPRHGHAYFVATGLPSAPSKKVYELWLMHDSHPVAAGIFHGGSGTSIVAVSRSSAGFNQTAVTVERGPNGVTRPTGKIVLFGKLGA